MTDASVHLCATDGRSVDRSVKRSRERGVVAIEVAGVRSLFVRRPGWRSVGSALRALADPPNIGDVGGSPVLYGFGGPVRGGTARRRRLDQIWSAWAWIEESS